MTHFFAIHLCRHKKSQFIYLKTIKSTQWPFICNQSMGSHKNPKGKWKNNSSFSLMGLISNSNRKRTKLLIYGDQAQTWKSRWKEEMNTDFSWVEMKKENGKVTKCIPDFHSRRCLPKMKGRTEFHNCCGVPGRRERSPKMPPSTMPNTSLSGWKRMGLGFFNGSFSGLGIF